MSQKGRMETNQG